MECIKLLRPAQWSKNLFVFLPLFFAQSITDLPRLYACCVAFVLLCLVSSSIYILNDIKDVEYDRQHPQKCRRPIASGSVVASATAAERFRILEVVVITSRLTSAVVPSR
ncbi:MAG: UbiA family prenyltransferase [Bacteroidaceae bacterium]|nr:UbiA family prenyltransferase [Bacteroidaceae bacterium]